jgi:hypothetical protein
MRGLESPQSCAGLPAGIEDRNLTGDLEAAAGLLDGLVQPADSSSGRSSSA